MQSKRVVHSEQRSWFFGRNALRLNSDCWDYCGVVRRAFLVAINCVIVTYLWLSLSHSSQSQILNHTTHVLQLTWNFCHRDVISKCWTPPHSKNLKRSETWAKDIWLTTRGVKETDLDVNEAPLMGVPGAWSTISRDTYWDHLESSGKDWGSPRNSKR